MDAAHTLAGDAGALIAVTNSAYDLAHERIVRALLARQANNARAAVALAGEARRQAEGLGLASFYAYATAIEASARVDVGELHSGALLARTALGSAETVSSEYGVELRVLACEALRKSSPGSAREACERAIHHARKILDSIRDPQLVGLFGRRPAMLALVAEAEASGVKGTLNELRARIQAPVPSMRRGEPTVDGDAAEQPSIAYRGARLQDVSDVASDSSSSTSSLDDAATATNPHGRNERPGPSSPR
jgi:hypothetical protein